MSQQSRARRAPKTREEAEAREELRRKSLRVSTFCLHAMAWVLVTFYATDYLPPLLIRATVGLGARHSVQFAVGYLALASICLVLGMAFGVAYAPTMAHSRFRLRWYVFPLLVAMLLIPIQGENQLLTKVVELVCLGLAMVAGTEASLPVRRLIGRRRPSSTT